MRILSSLTFVVCAVSLSTGCGGETPPPAAPESVTAPKEATPAEPRPADAKPAEAKNDFSGTWCGKQVAEASACKGDDVIYMTITQAADKVDATMCEAFNKKDCAKLESSSMKDGALTLAMNWGQGKKTNSWTLKPNADGTLAGEISGEKKPIAKTFYRVK